MIKFRKEDKMKKIEELKVEAKELKDRFSEVTKKTKQDIELNRMNLDPILKDLQYARDDLNEMESFKKSFEAKPYVAIENDLLKKLNNDITSNNLTKEVFDSAKNELREAYKEKIDEILEETIELRNKYLESFSKAKALYDEGNKEIFSLELVHNKENANLFERCHTGNYTKLQNEIKKINKGVTFKSNKKRGIF